jgi:hypothetical protein
MQFYSVVSIFVKYEAVIICLLFRSCHTAQCTTNSVTSPTSLGCNRRYADLKAAKWDELPESLQQEFTSCGSIPVEHMYVVGDNGTHYTYEREDIENYITHSQKLLRSQTYRRATLSRSEQWVVSSLTKLQLKNAHCAIIGSSSPFYESMLIALGVAKVTVFEYNDLTYNHEKIFVDSSFDQYKTDKGLPKFDFIFAISSLDHDGLGRYGDTICPSSDFLSMERFKTMLSSTGKLILTVPLGLDLLVWNVMRIYGELRLKRLLEGWNIVDQVGYEAEKLAMKWGGSSTWRKTYEPVFVLEVNRSKIKLSTDDL